MKTSESGLCGAEASSSSGGEVGPCTGGVGSGVVGCAALFSLKVCLVLYPIQYGGLKIITSLFKNECHKQLLPLSTCYLILVA